MTLQKDAIKMAQITDSHDNNLCCLTITILQKKNELDVMSYVDKNI